MLPEMDGVAHVALADRSRRGVVAAVGILRPAQQGEDGGQPRDGAAALADPARLDAVGVGAERMHLLHERVERRERLGLDREAARVGGGESHRRRRDGVTESTRPGVRALSRAW